MTNRLNVGLTFLNVVLPCKISAQELHLAKSRHLVSLPGRFISDSTPTAFQGPPTLADTRRQRRSSLPELPSPSRAFLSPLQSAVRRFTAPVKAVCATLASTFCRFSSIVPPSAVRSGLLFETAPIFKTPEGESFDLAGVPPDITPALRAALVRPEQRTSALQTAQRSMFEGANMDRIAYEALENDGELRSDEKRPKEGSPIRRSHAHERIRHLQRVRLAGGQSADLSGHARRACGVRGVHGDERRVAVGIGDADSRQRGGRGHVGGGRSRGLHLERDSRGFKRGHDGARSLDLHRVERGRNGTPRNVEDLRNTIARTISRNSQDNHAEVYS